MYKSILFGNAMEHCDGGILYKRIMFIISGHELYIFSVASFDKNAQLDP